MAIEQKKSIPVHWILSIPAAVLMLWLVIWAMTKLITPAPINPETLLDIEGIEFIRAQVQDQTELPQNSPENPEYQPPEPPIVPSMETPAITLPKPEQEITDHPVIDNQLDLTFNTQWLDDITRPTSPNTGPKTKPLVKTPPPAFDKDLFPLSTPDPIFPSRAKRRKIQGWVNIEYTINIDGSVSNAVVLAAEPEGVFERSALKAVARWKYKPQLLGGKPTARRVVQTIEFRL